MYLIVRTIDTSRSRHRLHRLIEASEGDYDLRQDGIRIAHTRNGIWTIKWFIQQIHNRASIPSGFFNTFILMTHTGAKCLDEVCLPCSKSALMGISGMKIRLSIRSHHNWTRGAGLNQDTISSLDKIIG